MRKSVGAFLGLSVAMALFGAACTDSNHSPTAPVTAGSTASGSLLGISLVPPVHRTTPLASDISWTFTAGPLGATSSNAATGLSVIIPAGALATTQTITVTALAGDAVAYRFEPHLVFDKQVTLKQNLAGTDVNIIGVLLGSLLLNGAHFAGDVLDVNSSGLVLVDEVVPASLLSILLTKYAVFRVGHFSGWILTSGTADEGGY